MNPRHFQRQPTLAHRRPDTRKFASAGAAFAAHAPFAIFPSVTIPGGGDLTRMLNVPGLGSFLAWADSARILADLLTGLFSGVPKLLKTTEAVARLAQSTLPQFQQLARNLEIWVRNGVPLSTGDPKLRAQLTGWINGTLTQSGLGLTPAQVPLVNQTLWRLFASQTALPARALDALVQSFQRVNQARGSVTGVSLPQPTPPRPPAPPPPPAVHHARELARGIQDQQVAAEVGGCLALALVNPEAAAFCLGEVAKSVLETGARQILQDIRNLFRPTRQPQQPPPPFQPPPSHPLMELTQDGTGFKIPCPSCDRIARQRGELQQEIETETQQDISKKLDSIQQQLDRLHQLEGQPSQFRDIPKELGQKQQLAQQLDQIQREAQQGSGQPQLQPPPPSGQPMKPPPPRTGHLELVCPPGFTQCRTDTQCETFGDCMPVSELGGEPAPQGQETPTPKLQFCVGCANEEDAILFLNGEPSACSVIPGSTKQLGG